MASAVLLSTLGAAGTVLGAAIGSFVVVVGSAMFAQGLSTSKRRLAKTQKDAAEKVGTAQAEVLRAARADDPAAEDSHLDHADERLAEARESSTRRSWRRRRSAWRVRLSWLPWKHIGLTTLALLVVALVVITAIELVAGQSVSSSPGGPTPAPPPSGMSAGATPAATTPEPDHQPTGSTDPSESIEPSDVPTDSPSPLESEERSPID